MSSLDPNQLAVAKVLFSLPAARDYALVGGSALLVSGVIERPTRDVDAFVAASPGPSPGDVRPLVDELVPALEKKGWSVEIVREHETFARLVATRRDATVDIDLAVDSPPLFPILEVGGLPVLAPQDLAARKVLAILDRAEGRDYSDLRSLAERLGREDCIAWAVALDAGVRPETVAEAFGNLDRLGDHELPTDDPSGLREFYETWSDELRAD